MLLILGPQSDCCPNMLQVKVSKIQKAPYNMGRMLRGGPNEISRRLSQGLHPISPPACLPKTGPTAMATWETPCHSFLSPNVALFVTSTPPLMVSPWDCAWAVDRTSFPRSESLVAAMTVLPSFNSCRNRHKLEHLFIYRTGQVPGSFP